MQEAWKEADAAPTSGRWPLSPAELRLAALPADAPQLPRDRRGALRLAEHGEDPGASVYQKLGVSSRAEAVACARTAGLLSSGESLGTAIAARDGSTSVHDFTPIT